MIGTVPVARYFFSPGCPESFATLDKLVHFFHGLPVIFERYNVLEDELTSANPFSADEKKLLAVLERGEGTPLLYGKLYLNGDEVAGFPPAPELLKRRLADPGLPYDASSYPFSYGAQPARISNTGGELRLELYRTDNLDYLVKLCTKHHPYLAAENYREEEWRPYEERRKSFVQRLLNSGDIIGVIAFAGAEEAGFIEGIPLPLSQKFGYPVCGVDGIMITCLSVRSEFKGQRVAGQLLDALEAGVLRRGRGVVQVLAFPDRQCWQPVSLYRKRDYQTIKDVEGLSLMCKPFKE